MADTKRTIHKGKPIGVPRKMFMRSLFDEEPIPGTTGKTVFARPPAVTTDMEYSGKRFDGVTYDPQYDQKRLSNQMQRVFDVMKDGQWRTLDELGTALEPGGPITPVSSSSRLRDLRKARFGGHQVDRRARDRAAGLFEYRLVLPIGTTK